MQNFESKETKELLKILENVKDSLPANKVIDASNKYNVVLSFFTDILKKLHLGDYQNLKVDVSMFKEEETKWMVTLHGEWMNYILHYTNKDALLDVASLMTNNDILDAIFVKLTAMKFYSVLGLYP